MDGPSCAELQTHTPVDREQLPFMVQEFVRSIQTDSLAMNDLRRIIGFTAIGQDLSRWGEDQIVRQLGQQLAGNSLKAVACGFEKTSSAATLFLEDESCYHIGLSVSQMVTCLSYPSHKVISFENVSKARKALETVVRSSGVAELRKAARIQPALRDMPRTDDALLDSLAESLMRGGLILVGCGSKGGNSLATGLYGEAEETSRSRSRSASNAASRERQAPVEEKIKTWIEIRLIDQDGKPVANERYRLELPDGTLKEGSLDKNGRARVEDIDPGNCKVSFLDIHGSEWKAA